MNFISVIQLQPGIYVYLFIWFLLSVNQLEFKLFEQRCAKDQPLRDLGSEMVDFADFKTYMYLAIDSIS